MMNGLIVNLETRQEALRRKQEAMSLQMKQDGSHILSGHPYTPSTQGSKILRKYIATEQQRFLAALYRCGESHL